MTISDAITIIGVLVVVIIIALNVYYNYWVVKKLTLFQQSRNWIAKNLTKLNIALGVVFALFLGYFLIFPALVSSSTLIDGGVIIQNRLK